MRRTDRLRSVRELNPHAGLPAAARTRARETAGSQKGPAPTPAPLYSRRIAAQDIGRRAGSQAGDREPEGAAGLPAHRRGRYPREPEHPTPLYQASIVTDLRKKLEA